MGWWGISWPRGDIIPKAGICEGRCPQKTESAHQHVSVNPRDRHFAGCPGLGCLRGDWGCDPGSCCPCKALSSVSPSICCCHPHVPGPWTPCSWMCHRSGQTPVPGGVCALANLWDAAWGWGTTLPAHPCASQGQEGFRQGTGLCSHPGEASRHLPVVEAGWDVRGKAPGSGVWGVAAGSD